jgi:hypothetical protein
VTPVVGALFAKSSFADARFGELNFVDVRASSPPGPGKLLRDPFRDDDGVQALFAFLESWIAGGSVVPF